jgi:type VI secretion system protein ImpG
MSSRNPRLLASFQRELDYLRRAGSAFARRYPKVAERLDFTSQESADPHVERLLESFAFLSGRIQATLDNDFPEIPAALLDVLYPHFTQPVPSMVIARLESDPDEGNLETGYLIERETQLFAQAGDGTNCYFRTCFPLTLWPVEISDIKLDPAANYEFLDNYPEVATVLTVSLDLTKTDGDFAASGMDSIRFHLSGEQATSFNLYELLFSSVVEVAVKPIGDEVPVLLGPDSLMPVGFSGDEAVLPDISASHQAYRLLQEYFVFPDKFLFFEIAGLKGRLRGQSCDLMILLNDVPTERLSVSPSSLSLNCVPLVNLFQRTSEPIRLDETRSEYRLNPDLRNERTTEIHSIQNVSASADASNVSGRVAPFFSYTHAEERSEQSCFWLTRREDSQRGGISGTDVLISLLDLNFKPSQPPTRVLFAQTLCTNRNLCAQLPAGALLQLEEDAPVLRSMTLTKPTQQLTPPLEGKLYWRLISHLSLNYLSLSDGEDGLNALKEILKLYAFRDSQSVSHQINGMRHITCRRVVRRVGNDAWRGVCQGIEIKLTLDPALYVGASGLMLGAVLNRFFGLYAGSNSFTELVIERNDMQGEWKRWPALVGEQPLL